MYIARKLTSEGYEYFIRESYFEAPYYRSRTLFYLGSHPEKYIQYYSEVAFCITIEEDLKKQGVETDQFELEELFFRFLSPEAQRCVASPFNRRRRDTTRKDVKVDLKAIHEFDAIRYIAIKLGVTNPKKYLGFPFSFFKHILKKSRDEIENFFWDIEDNLKYKEKIRYMEAIFDLCFVEVPEVRDTIFLERLCKIAEDENYRMGLSREQVLRDYLARYVWFYFDAMPVRRPPAGYENYYYEEVLKEIAWVLEIPLKELVTKSKEEILKLFKRKMKEVHPDKGGSHETFIRLREVMEKYFKNF